MMASIRCWSVKNILDLYLDGRLCAGAAARVAGHLETCAACREAVSELGGVPTLLKAEEKVSVPEGLEAAIIARLAAEAGAADEDESLGAGLAGLWEYWRLSPAQAAAIVYLVVLAGSHALPGTVSQAWASDDAASEVLR